MTNYIVWVVIGVVVGATTAFLLENRDFFGTLRDVLVGIIGAIGGGFLMRAVSGDGLDEFRMINSFVALAIAVIFVGSVRLLVDRSSTLHFGEHDKTIR